MGNSTNRKSSTMSQSDTKTDPSPEVEGRAYRINDAAPDAECNSGNACSRTSTKHKGMALRINGPASKK